MHGLYILAGPNVTARGRHDGRWNQIAPTLRGLLGLAPSEERAVTLLA
jgi:hypothetical protein